MENARLKGLDALRALCALFILWGHIAQKDFCQWNLFSIPLPICCAYVFFTVSGFLAGYRMDSVRSRSVGSYLKWKSRRILPAYYLYILISVVVFAALSRLDEVLNDRLFYYLFLFPSIPFCTQDGILPLVHLWFIGTIALFYLSIPFFARLRKEKAPAYALFIAVVWFVLKMAVRFILGKDTFAFRFLGITCFDILYLGVWAGMLERKGCRLFQRIKESRLIGIFAWVLFLLSGVYGVYVPAPVRTEFMALVALAIILTQQTSRPIPCLENKVFHWLGNISYEIYVVQIIVIILLSRGCMALQLTLPDIVIYLVAALVVTGCAWAFHAALHVFDERHSSKTPA